MHQIPSAHSSELFSSSTLSLTLSIYLTIERSEERTVKKRKMIGYTVMGKTRNMVKQEDILVTVRVFVTENYKLYLGTFQIYWR